MFDLNLNNLGQVIPWFMYDINNYILITSITVPQEIHDQKGIVITEIAIPGLNYKPVQYGGGDNRKISFQIEIIKRNNTVGNTLIIKAFENLRNQVTSLTDIFAEQFQPNPKVLYYWGTGSLPNEYFVAKCDPTHYWVNALGNPQRSVYDIELILDESSLLYKAEEIYRKISSIAGAAENAYQTKKQLNGNSKMF